MSSTNTRYSEYELVQEANKILSEQKIEEFISNYSQSKPENCNDREYQLFGYVEYMSSHPYDSDIYRLLKLQKSRFYCSQFLEDDYVSITSLIHSIISDKHIELNRRELLKHTKKLFENETESILSFLKQNYNASKNRKKYEKGILTSSDAMSNDTYMLYVSQLITHMRVTLRDIDVDNVIDRIEKVEKTVELIDYFYNVYIKDKNTIELENDFWRVSALIEEVKEMYDTLLFEEKCQVKELNNWLKQESERIMH